MKSPITRRHALRSIGSLISLPFLESMLPSGLRAAASVKPPVRLVWLYAGSGMFMPAYKPAATGRAWDNSKEIAASAAITSPLAEGIKPLSTLDPLLPFKDDVSILSGLLHAGAFTRGTVASGDMPWG